ncbi:MAG: hypothetical protein IPJ69_10965 [Deltaproteobacteria bacterium]|nr:MAG: hypothetical protein IPJ69_10965 [Deltaproteobacteria bacterium]
MATVHASFTDLWNGWLTAATAYTSQVAQFMCPDGPAREGAVLLLSSPLGCDATVAELRALWPVQLAAEKALDHYRQHPDQIGDTTLAQITALTSQQPQLGLLGLKLHDLQRTHLPRYSTRLPEVVTTRMLEDEEKEITSCGWPEDILAPVLKALGEAQSDHDRVPRFADAAILAQVQHFALTTPGVTATTRPFMEICQFCDDGDDGWVQTLGDYTQRECWYGMSSQGDPYFWAQVLRSGGYQNVHEYPPLIEMRIDLNQLPEAHRLMVLSSWKGAAAKRIQGALSNKAIMAFEKAGILILRVIVPSVLEMALRNIHGNSFNGFTYDARFSTREEMCVNIESQRHCVALLWKDTPFHDYPSLDGKQYPRVPPINITIHDEYHGADHVLVSPSIKSSVPSLVRAVSQLSRTQDYFWSEAASRLLIDMETSARYSFEEFIEEKIIGPLFMYHVLYPQIQARSFDEKQRLHFIFFWDQLRSWRGIWRNVVIAWRESIFLDISLNKDMPVPTKDSIQGCLVSLQALKQVLESLSDSSVIQSTLFVINKWEAFFSLLSHKL